MVNLQFIKHLGQKSIIYGGGINCSNKYFSTERIGGSIFIAKNLNNIVNSYPALKVLYANKLEALSKLNALQSAKKATILDELDYINVSASFWNKMAELGKTNTTSFYGDQDFGTWTKK